MVGHGGSSAGSYLADPTSPMPSHCALIVATSTLTLTLPGPSAGVGGSLTVTVAQNPYARAWGK